MSETEVAELTGAALDYWVARALGATMQEFFSGEGWRLVPTRHFPELADWELSLARLNMDPETMNGSDYYFHPSSDWSQAGPIIAGNDIGIATDYCGTRMAAMNNGNIVMYGDEDTPYLTLAMRAVVASVYGYTVPAEDEPCT